MRSFFFFNVINYRKSTGVFHSSILCKVEHRLKSLPSVGSDWSVEDSIKLKLLQHFIYWKLVYCHRFHF